MSCNMRPSNYWTVACARLLTGHAIAVSFQGNRSPHIWNDQHVAVLSFHRIFLVALNLVFVAYLIRMSQMRESESTDTALENNSLQIGNMEFATHTRSCPRVLWPWRGEC